MRYFLSFTKLFGDICLWLACGGGLLSIFIVPSNLLPAALLHGLGSAAALLLDKKGDKLRYLGLIFPLLTLLMGRTLPQFLLLIPAVVYSGFVIHRRQLLPDYDDLYGIFYPTAIASIAGGILCAVRGVDWGITAAFLYLCVLVFLQRVHRHQNQETWDGKLLLLEGGLLGLICGLGLIISHPQVFAALKEGGMLLVRLVGTPVVTVLGLLLYGVIWLFGKLISLLRGEGNGAVPMGLPDLSLTDTDWLGQEAVANASPAALWVVRIIGILAFLAVAGFLLRALLRRRGTGIPPEGGEDSRATLKDGADIVLDKAPKITDRSPETRVRRAFGSYCRALTAAGFTLSPGCTTRDVNRAAGDFGKLPQAVRLRELYLRARYTHHSGLTSAEAKEAANLAKELKKTILAK